MSRGDDDQVGRSAGTAWHHFVKPDGAQRPMYMSGVMFGQLASAQGVVCEILCACLKVFGCPPLRDAA